MKKIYLFLFLTFYCTLIFSQENVISSGNKISSSYGTLNYTIGLLNYKEISGTGGTSSSGTQLPYEISTVLSTNDENLISLSFYPNPTKDYFYINLKTIDSLTYTLCDFNGRVVSKGSLNLLQNKLNLKRLSSSIFFLNILKSGKIIKSFKIIKK
jgi:hypothetical protein